MDESDPRVEYRKQVALKLNYIMDTYKITAIEIAKKCDMKYSSYVGKLKNPKDSATLNEKHMKNLEKKLGIPKEIFNKRDKFNPELIDDLIAKYREKIGHQKEEKKSILSLPINTQLTLKSGKENLVGRKVELKEIETLLDKTL